MSAYAAFAGEASRKAGLLTRLGAHIAAGELRFDADVWDGTGGRPTGCVAHSSDIKVFATETGMPACLGLLLDFLHRQHQGAEDAQATASANAFAIDWMSRPAPGADMSRAPSDLIVKALRRERGDDPNLAARCPELVRILDRAIELHGEVRDGRLPERRTWTELREAAVAATDGAESATDKAVGTAVESICWNPLSSRSILIDFVRPWVEVRHNHEILASGWTDADQKQADAILEALWNEMTPQREAGEAVPYAALFSERAPDLEARFRAKLGVGETAWRAGMMAFAGLALAALGDATSAALDR